MDSRSETAGAAAPSGSDPALQPFLEAAEPADADRLLGDLLDRVTRTVRDVVRRVMRPRVPAGADADLEDVASEAMLRVLGAVRELKADACREPIQNLDAYAARTATHACYELFRKRHPGRARLRNQIWYVLSRDPDFTLVRGSDDLWMCGLTPGAAAPTDADANAAGARALPRVLREILERSGRTLELNDLVSIAAGEIGLPTGPALTLATGPNPEALADASAPSPLDALDTGQQLARLWQEVRQLPLGQRTALLLNLRDAGGGDALDLLPLTGTATLREIAAALELPAGELARLWPGLPLDDNAIARRLGITRQQVINLRKSARARLARRMAAPAIASSGGTAARDGNTSALRDSHPETRPARA